MYQSIYCDRKTSTIHLWDDIHGYTSFKDEPYAYRKSRNGKYKSIFGDSLEKITKFNFRDPTLFSSDIPVDTRVLIDAYGDSDEVSINHRRAYIDIEVDSVGGYPNIEDPIKEVTAIALLDEFKDTYYCFILDKDGVVQNENKDNTIILPYLNEEDLLVAFLKKWDEVKPTIVSGWNIDGFDFPYLHARLVRVLGEEAANVLSPINICYFNKYKNKMTIAGVNALDYLVLYKKYSGKNLTNYRLDTVAKEELKIGKIEYEGSLNDLMKSDIKKFIEYNLHDIILVKKMNDQLQFIELAMSICHVCHVGYEEFGMSSKFLEGALLTYLRRKKLIAPNKKLKLDVVDRDDDLADDVGFEGAYVKDPVPGRYDWVCSADINSLYPSVIMSLNISPETKVGIIKDWDSEKLVKKSGEKIAFDNEVYTYEDFGKIIVDNNLSVSANGIVYDQSKLGCIPDILKTWFAERVEYKTKMKDASTRKDKEQYVFWKRRQHVQKILLNSMYGVLGLQGWRAYDLDNALAVTSTGQEIIKNTDRYVNSQIIKKTGKKYKITYDDGSVEYIYEKQKQTKDGEIISNILDRNLHKNT
jgi:DNA polymerase elongation subunit (family B)